MYSRRANLKCWGLIVVMAAGGSWCGLGQSAAPAGQAIKFSSPDGTDGAADSPSLTPRASPWPVFSSAPPSSSVFNFGAPDNAVPLPPPQVFAPSQQARDAAELEKNWVLMTPEEILGVKTPEQIMGITARDASGQEKRLTPLERYWNRQNTAHGTATNRYPAADGLGHMNFSDGPNNPAPAENPPTARALDSKSIWSKLLNSSPEAARQNDGGIWQKLMGPTPPSPTFTAPTPAQLADMERFHQLLGTMPPTTVTATAPVSPIYASPDSSSDPIFGELKANPAGASFKPLSSGIGMPKGLEPLPGITTPNPPSTAPASPSLIPQNPPWVMTGPNLFAPPLRKF